MMRDAEKIHAGSAVKGLNSRHIRNRVCQAQQVCYDSSGRRVIKFEHTYSSKDQDAILESSWLGLSLRRSNLIFESSTKTKYLSVPYSFVIYYICYRLSLMKNRESVYFWLIKSNILPMTESCQMRCTVGFFHFEIRNLSFPYF